MVLLRISPDGKEVVHLYNDKVFAMTSKTCDTEVHRASEVYYCNKDEGWKIKLLDTGLVLPAIFAERQKAIDYEIEFLEELLRQDKLWISKTR